LPVSTTVKQVATKGSLNAVSYKLAGDKQLRTTLCAVY